MVLTKTGKAKHASVDSELPFVVELEYDHNVNTITEFPSSIYEKLPPLKQVNTAGFIWQNFNMTHGPPGLFYLRASAKEEGA